MRSFDDIIVRDPGICGGQPVIRGTRVLLRTILASLAAGDRVEDILRGFPTLKREHVEGVIALAATSAQEDLAHPLQQHDDLKGVVFHEDPTDPLSEEDWPSDLR